MTLCLRLLHIPHRENHQRYWLSNLWEFMTQWVLPTYQFAAQQGAELDVPLVTRILSDYMGFDNFNQFYRTAIPHELDGVGYTMEPLGQGKRPSGPNVGSKSPGKTNDFFGSSESSRTANSQRQQAQEFCW